MEKKNVPGPKPESSVDSRMTLKLRLNPNNTLYVDAQNEAQVRAAILALPGVAVKLPSGKK